MSIEFVLLGIVVALILFQLVQLWRDDYKELHDDRLLKLFIARNKCRMLDLKYGRDIGEHRNIKL